MGPRLRGDDVDMLQRISPLANSSTPLTFINHIETIP
jgi:hypothetical protein